MANLNLSQFGENTSVSDADYTFVWDSAASISKKVSRNSWLNSGTLTSDAPVTISQTWNNAAVAFTGLKVNAVSTASASASLLLDLQVGGVTQLSVTKAGAVNVTGAVSTPAQFIAGDAIFANGNGVRYVSTWIRSAGFDGGLLFRNNTQTQSVGVVVEADNTLALRNGTAAQTFNVYGTYTSGSVYERLTLSAPSAANAIIGTNKGSGGGTARGLDLHTDGAARMTITTAGNVGIGTTDPDNALTVRSTTNNVNGVGQLILLSSDALAADKGGRFGLAGIYDNVNGRALFAEVAGLKENATSGNWAGYLTLRTRAAGGAITDRLRIDSVGNVGIGTTAPGAKLQVVGNAIFGENLASPTINNVSFGGSYGTSTPGNKANLKWDMYNDGTNRYGIGMSTNLMEFQAGINGGFGFYPNNGTTSALHIINSGNVGIGTTAPTAPLHVQATAGTDNRETLFKGTISDAGNDAFHIFNGTSANGRFAPSFSASTFSSNVGSLIFTGQTNAANDNGTQVLVIFNARITNSETDPNNGTLSAVTTRPLFAWNNHITTHMQMAANGNLGIGTTSPTSKLHVAGSSSPSITVDNTLATGASQLLFKNTVVTGDTDGIFLNGSTQTGFGGAGSLNIKATTGPIAFHTTSVTNVLSIAQNGATTFASQVNAGSFVGGGLSIAFNQLSRNSGSVISFPSNGTIQFTNNAGTDFNLLQLGGTTASFPAIKRSTVRIQAVLANDSGFTNIQGKLTTDTDYTATVVTPTGFLTLYDAQGTAYRVPCVLAP